MTKSEMLECLINYYTDGNKSKFANKLKIKPQTINSWIIRNRMDMELKLGMMVLHIKDIIKKEKKMELENIYGLMEVNILEIGKIMNIMDLELIYSKCENLSADWLLSSGQGEMIIKKQQSVADSTLQRNFQDENIDSMKREIALLRDEVERLRLLKLPTKDEKALDVSMKFFEAAKEMFAYYHQIKGE